MNSENAVTATAMVVNTGLTRVSATLNTVNV